MNIVLVLVLIVAAVLVTYWLTRRDLTRQFESEVAKRSRSAVTTSRSSHFGLIAEQLAPYLPGFPYDPKDVRHLGAPCDLIVYDGLEDGEVHSVVFLEVKTGTSRLNGNQRLIRDAIKRGAVSYEVYRVPKRPPARKVVTRPLPSQVAIERGL